jgi:hypothetical protein
VTSSAAFLVHPRLLARPVYKNAPMTRRGELDAAGNLKLAPESPKSRPRRSADLEQ